jgi:hypothetical protein
MKLNVVRFVYEAPGLEIIPETEYEAAVLSRYWESAKLSTGRASPEVKSANGLSYGIKFAVKFAGPPGKEVEP